MTLAESKVVFYTVGASTKAVRWVWVFCLFDSTAFIGRFCTRTELSAQTKSIFAIFGNCIISKLQDGKYKKQGQPTVEWQLGYAKRLTLNSSLSSIRIVSYLNYIWLLPRIHQVKLADLFPDRLSTYPQKWIRDWFIAGELNARVRGFSPSSNHSPNPVPSSVDVDCHTPIRCCCLLYNWIFFRLALIGPLPVGQDNFPIDHWKWLSRIINRLIQ